MDVDGLEEAEIAMPGRHCNAHVGVPAKACSARQRSSEAFRNNDSQQHACFSSVPLRRSAGDRAADDAVPRRSAHWTAQEGDGDGVVREFAGWFGGTVPSVIGRPSGAGCRPLLWELECSVSVEQRAAFMRMTGRVGGCRAAVRARTHT
jgi:hypothetical protein